MGPADMPWKGFNLNKWVLMFKGFFVEICTYSIIVSVE